MNRRTKKKKEAAIRKQIHEILDLVLDINGLQESDQEITGNHPTAFFDFSGHVGAIRVRLYSNGWNRDGDYDVSLESSIFEDFRYDLPAVVEKLRGVAYGTS